MWDKLVELKGLIETLSADIGHSQQRFLDEKAERPGEAEERVAEVDRAVVTAERRALGRHRSSRDRWRRSSGRERVY